MTVDIQATGNLGIAFETTAGTFVAASKFFPIRSENLKYVQENQDRRLIRGIADILGQVNGVSHVEGDIVMEVLPDVLPYFLYASRNTVAKSGVSPLTYTCTPFHGANPTSARTLSITTTRNGLGFGYTGCVVSQMKFGIDNGVLICTLSIVGRDEATQTPPTPTFANQSPFGHGMYTIGNPTGSTVTDVDTFELTINDNAKPEYRLASVRTPQFVRYAERTVELSAEMDFQARTEYDAFKALTARSIRIIAANGANANFQATLPVTVKKSYDIDGLGNQGDLVRAKVDYVGDYDAGTSKAYELIVVTTESIT